LLELAAAVSEATQLQDRPRDRESLIRRNGLMR
jgi:hypothetical protein